MLVLRLLSAVVAFVAVVLAFPKDPSKDSFYKPDSGWQDASPGDILDWRRVEPTVASFLDMDVAGYQLLYRTKGVKGPKTTVTTVLVPSNHAHDKIVSVNVYEDSFSAKCAPSYSIQKGAQLYKDIEFTYQQLFMLTLLNEGWIVVVPDHEGSENSFVSGIPQGHAVLDGMRAVLNFDQVKTDRDAKLFGYGYSGGGEATGWAASLHRRYAGELNVVGWAMGGVIADVENWFKYLDGSHGAGFVAAGLAGLAESYDELHWVKESLTLKGKQTWKDTSERCMLENLNKFSFKKIISNEMFRNGDNFYSDDGAKRVFSMLKLGNSDPPKAPVYMYHSSHDEVVPYGSVIDTANNWCGKGATIRFSTNSGVSMKHDNTELFNHPEVVHFMRDRFSGKHIEGHCNFRTVSNPWFNPFTLGDSAAQFTQQILHLITGQFDHRDKVHQYDKDTSL